MGRPRATIALLGTLATLVVVATQWSSMPSTIPIHFGVHGEANGYGTRDWLWFPVALSWFTYGLLSLVLRFPGVYNLPVDTQDERRPAYEARASVMVMRLRTALAWLCCVVALAEVQGAHGAHWMSRLLPWLTVGLGTLPVALFLRETARLRAR